MIHVHVCRWNGSEPEYLLLHRSVEDLLYPGMWQIVTGVKEGPEKAYVAALREVSEETGLAPKELLVVPHVGAFYDMKEDAVDLVPVFAGQVELFDTVELSKEHDAFEWCTYDEAMSRFIIPAYIEGLRILHNIALKSRNTDKFPRVNVDGQRRE